MASDLRATPANDFEALRKFAENMGEHMKALAEELIRGAEQRAQVKHNLQSDRAGADLLRDARTAVVHDFELLFEAKLHGARLDFSGASEQFSLHHTDTKVPKGRYRALVFLLPLEK